MALPQLLPPPSEAIQEDVSEDIDIVQSVLSDVPALEPGKIAKVGERVNVSSELVSMSKRASDQTDAPPGKFPKQEPENREGEQELEDLMFRSNELKPAIHTFGKFGLSKLHRFSYLVDVTVLTPAVPSLIMRLTAIQNFILCWGVSEGAPSLLDRMWEGRDQPPLAAHRSPISRSQHHLPLHPPRIGLRPGRSRKRAQTALRTPMVGPRPNLRQFWQRRQGYETRLPRSQPQSRREFQATIRRISLLQFRLSWILLLQLRLFWWLRTLKLRKVSPL